MSYMAPQNFQFILRILNTNVDGRRSEFSVAAGSGAARSGVGGWRQHTVLGGEAAGKSADYCLALLRATRARVHARAILVYSSAMHLWHGPLHPRACTRALRPNPP